MDLTAFDLPDEVAKEIADHIATLEDAVTDLTAQVQELKPEPEENPVDKAAPEVQDLVAKLREENEATSAALAAEIAKRRDAEFVAKIRESGLAAMFENADEAGPLLRKIADAAPEEWEVIEPQLVAFTQSADFGSLFAEKGTDAGDADPYARRDAWVKNYIAENPEADLAKARTLFWKAHPDLYESVGKGA